MQIYVLIYVPTNITVSFVQNLHPDKKKNQTEVFRQLSDSLESGRRDSNPRPSAWKANALSTELLPQTCVGKDGFEPPKA